MNKEVNFRKFLSNVLKDENVRSLFINDKKGNEAHVLNNLDYGQIHDLFKIYLKSEYLMPISYTYTIKAEYKSTFRIYNVITYKGDEYIFTVEYNN